MVFADPPYFLSNGGSTCQNGKRVAVSKGDWDKSRGLPADLKFTLDWLRGCKQMLKPNGTLWVTGTQKDSSGNVDPRQGQPALVVINSRGGFIAGYTADITPSGNPYSQVP